MSSIRIKGLSKTFGSRAALDDVSLEIEPGEMVALIGASGSGKSTLLRHVSGLAAADARGESLVQFGGRTVQSGGRLAFDVRELRAQIGFVFQFFHLIPSLTAHENVAVPMEIAGVADARGRATALLEEVGLTGRSHHYPSQLSGGEQQRVALARALANDPPIVLADEPTGNLDSQNGRHIMELLRGVHERRGSTIVLVTHDAELAALADTRIVLRDGKVVENTDVIADRELRIAESR